jgi:hypothetical protein
MTRIVGLMLAMFIMVILARGSASKYYQIFFGPKAASNNAVTGAPTQSAVSLANQQAQNAVNNILGK